MAKTGEKSRRRKDTKDADKLTRHTCEITGERITLGDLYPVKDGMTGKMVFYSRKAFDATYKA